MAKKDKKQKKQQAKAAASGKKGMRSTKAGDKPPTQDAMPFAEIRDDLVIMRDGTLRAVLLVSSLNFALKSEDEQKGIIQGYVSFLNTIDFELQIVIQSRKLNIEKYLQELEMIARQQDNELLRKQTLSYRSFVSKLVEEADIMDKKFFVVIPYTPHSKKRKSYWTRLREVLSPAESIRLDQKELKEYKTEIERRVAQAQSGLQSVGLQVQQLDTQSLIELYYNTYNPVTNQQKRIEDLDKMRVDRSIQ